jgi:cytidylate kinase
MAILSISRESESGGGEIGRKIAERIGYEFVDKQRFLSELKDAGRKWEALGEEMDEVRPNVWEKYDWGYKGLVALIESAVYQYALKDRVVIMGQGSTFLLKNIPHCLRIRFVAPFEFRVHRLMTRENLDRTTAEWLIKKIDRDRAGYNKTLYGEDREVKSNYDLVFDIGELPQEQIIALVQKTLEEKDRMSTHEGLQRLKGYFLASKVKAFIYTQKNIFIPTLEILYDGESLVLRGVVHNKKEYHRVERMAHQIADPHPIRNELHYRQ